MKILFAASECAPFAKTGGLADVMGALPGALQKLGHDVRVVLPFYRCVKQGNFPCRRLDPGIRVQLGDKNVGAGIFQGELPDGTPAYFIQQDSYYDRDELYRDKKGDYPDNAERFIFFSKAILDLAKKLSFIPDIFHCHDWQTGLCPFLLASAHRDDTAFVATRCLFTIHNLAYQGIFWHWDLPMTNVGWEAFTPEFLEFYGKINLLKAGLVGADRITTVSRRYAEEIQTPGFGCGLEGVLRHRANQLTGILNGVDYGDWSPNLDALIAQRYDSQDLSGKRICRQDLLSQFGLTVSGHVPLLGMVSRLADQKGLDLLAESAGEILNLPSALIVLGTGEEKYHVLLKSLRQKYPDRVGIKLGFDNILAHKIEAGSDLFLMPSQFEPCGLNQIYSMRYGTIPVVRATGGLDDTVENYDPHAGTGSGFKFGPYEREAFVAKLREAVTLFQDKVQWKRLQQNAMACDFSWEASARQYDNVYRVALAGERHRINLVKV